MKIVPQTSEVLGECPLDYENAILRIERGGRICYRSEDKIVEGSGAKFVHNIVQRNHWSVIEHSNFVMRTEIAPIAPRYELDQMVAQCDSDFLHHTIHKGHVYIGGNFRAWMDHFNIKTIEALFKEPPLIGYVVVTDNEEVPLDLKMVSAEFVTDRSVTHELVRHRPCSFLQESQRYCAYRQHLEVILPAHYENSLLAGDYAVMANQQAWVRSVEYSERTYQQLIKNGERAEQARSVLPNCTATKIMMTASLPEWWHVFSLRCSKAAYPPIRNLLIPVNEEFDRRGWVPC